LLSDLNPNIIFPGIRIQAQYANRKRFHLCTSNPYKARKL
jgi:hypothetical protein